jgi:hypothetical protein
MLFPVLVEAACAIGLLLQTVLLDRNFFKEQRHTGGRNTRRVQLRDSFAISHR